MDKNTRSARSKGALTHDETHRHEPSCALADLASTPLTEAVSAQRDESTDEQAEVRGFALYVGIDEFRALADGTTLTEIAAELKALVQRIATSAPKVSSTLLCTHH